MKQPLLVIGAGDVGGFLCWNLDRFGLPFVIHGFLDDDPAKQGQERYGKRVLGPVEAMRAYAGMPVLVGIAAPSIRRRVVDRVSEFTDRFPSVVPSAAWISEGVRLGKGAIVYPGVSINYGADIGDFCILNMNCAIGHNCTVEAFSTLAPGVNLAGFTHIEEEVDIGIGASTRQRVRIGREAVVGGQSMVIRDVPRAVTVAGVPAEVLVRHHP